MTFPISDFKLIINWQLLFACALCSGQASLSGAERSVSTFVYWFISFRWRIHWFSCLDSTMPATCTPFISQFFRSSHRLLLLLLPAVSPYLLPARYFPFEWTLRARDMYNAFLYPANETDRERERERQSREEEKVEKCTWYDYTNDKFCACIYFSLIERCYCCCFPFNSVRSLVRDFLLLLFVSASLYYAPRPRKDRRSTKKLNKNQTKCWQNCKSRKEKSNAKLANVGLK